MKALTQADDLIARDIAALAAEARHLRTLLGTRWTRPMADEQRRRLAVAAKLTDLHVTLAHCRGRLHRASPPRGADSSWNARASAAAVTARILARYAAPPTEQAARSDRATQAAR